jgi:F420-dependent oxidoreductase-like protein
MRIGMPLGHGNADFRQTAEELVDFEKAGLDIVLVAEAYTFDSVSQLGYLAHATTNLQIQSGIFNIYSRTPALLAMTAAGLDFVSGGRFTVGLGASGPAVIEGFHGLKYDAPLGRTREVVDICRSVWRREKIDFHGEHYDIPLTKEKGGTGAAKPLKLVNHPVRERIPIVLAALGPRNVALAAEICEGWEPVFFYPESAAEVFGDSLAEGRAKRSTDLPPLEIMADTSLGVTDDREILDGYLERVRAQLALYIGGMGARGKNFYNQLAGRYGFEAEAAVVEDRFLSGDRAGAAAAVPEALVRGVALVGSQTEVAGRLHAFAEAGVTAINASPLALTHERRLRDIEILRELAG